MLGYDAFPERSSRCAIGLDVENAGPEKLGDAVRQGLAALDRGEFSEVADEELDVYLEELANARAG